MLAYADDVAGRDQRGEVSAVAEYVAAILRVGWTPDQWKGGPGELTLSRSMPGGKTDSGEMKKPWWRFW